MEDQGWQSLAKRVAEARESVVKWKEKNLPMM